MIRSDTVPSRTVAGISIIFRSRWPRVVPPAGGTALAPRKPTTAVPFRYNSRSAVWHARSGENTARNTTASQTGGSDNASPWWTSTFSSPRRRTALRARSTRRPDRSRRVTWLLGQRMARGIPGRPTPEPTSRSRGGGPKCSHPKANASESARWRSQIRWDSRGPIPPATIASWFNHWAKDSNCAHWWFCKEKRPSNHSSTRSTDSRPSPVCFT